MENRNLEKALDIVSKLITGEELTERGDNSSLYQEYNNNAEIYDIVHVSLKKLNLSIYEYNNGLYVSAGENNRVFGYTNEELRKELGIKVNKDLYMAYFVIYNIITEFYTASSNTTYVEFVKVEDIVKNVDYSVSAIIDKKLGMIIDVSHASDQSFRDILECTDGPVVASHSNCRALCRHLLKNRRMWKKVLPLTVCFTSHVVNLNRVMIILT